MALTGETLRGYVDYLRDLGVYDLYHCEHVAEDLAVQSQLSDLLKISSAAPAAPRSPVQSPSPRVLATASAPPRAPEIRQPASPVAPRPRSGPEILVHPLPSIAASQGEPALSEEYASTETAPYAPPAMPLVSFNQLAPLPSARVDATAKAAELQGLRTRIGDCTRCPLAYAGRHSIVFADGDPNADLMFVGEGPGADEDASGLPFVGKAGQLLNNMIGAMGLRRESVYIANIVMCRPPKNRTPEPVEANTCSRFLLEQIDIVQPKVIVALGSTAATYLLGVRQSLGALRGQWHDVRGAKCAVTYHPAFLLRDPRQKAEAWKDLQRVMAELQLKPPAKA